MRQHLERAGDIEGRVRVGKFGGAALFDVQAAFAGTFQHTRRQIDALCTTCEVGHALQQQARSAAHLEHVLAARKALQEAQLQIIDQVVVAVFDAPAAAVVVTLRELVVITLRCFEVLSLATLTFARAVHGR